MRELFIELLQVSLGTRESLSRAPNVLEWQGLLEEARRQAVVGVLFSGLEQLPDGVRPPKPVLLQWIGEAQMLEETGRLHRERATELTRRFRTAGYKSCVLKGVANALLYPDPLRRQCGDIDIWVNGKRKDVTAWMRTHCIIGHRTWHHTDAKFFKDVPVEVHFRPSWLYNPCHQKRLNRFFEDSKEKQMQKREEGFGHPTPVFNAVFSLTHVFHHLLEEGIGFRHVVDYFYIMQSLSPSERQKTCEVIKNVGMGKFLGSMMYVLHVACGMPITKLLCELNEKEGCFLLHEIESAGNFGSNRKGEELKHNSLKRFWVMFKHYPEEVIWMYPFKMRNIVWKVVTKD